MTEGTQPYPWLDRWLLGRAGDALAGAWGFAEGFLFFLVPDMLLTLTAAVSARRGLRQMGFAVAGSVAAGLLLFGWSARRPEGARDAVGAVPFVSAGMFERVDRDFERAGVWGMCLGPASGVPYKVYAVRGPSYTGWLPFALVSIPARLERLVITWAQFAAIGWGLRRWSKRARSWVLLIHAAYWVVVYATYWLTMGVR